MFFDIELGNDFSDRAPKAQASKQEGPRQTTESKTTQ